MIAALKKGDYDTAAKEMMDSKSGRVFRTRMSRLANIMKTGVE